MRLVMFAVVMAVSLPAAGQPTGAVNSPSFPRTAWDAPDLQGLWTNSTTTPLERPDAFAGRTHLTEEEVAELEASVAGRNDRPPRAGDPGTYNEFWWERGNFLDRTSLIVDPADGRIPSMTPAGEARAAWSRGTDSWEDRNLAERFTRTGADTMDHRYTVTDPTTYARPWTVAIPMTRFDGPMFEYACHEGNRGLENILTGARAGEAADGGSE